MEVQQKCSSNKNKNPNNGGDNEVETTRAERPVYLLKCPTLVSSTLRSQQHSNNNNNTINESSSSSVAKVIVSIDPLNCNDDTSQFTMELAGSESSAPKCYSLNMFTDINPPMSAFSLTKNGKVSVEGTVVKKFDMKPQNGSFKEYGKLCRERTNKYMVKTRQLQVSRNCEHISRHLSWVSEGAEVLYWLCEDVASLEPRHLHHNTAHTTLRYSQVDECIINVGMMKMIDNDRNMRPMPGMVHILTSISKDKKKATPVKGTETKRTRRDRGEMEMILFKLMERQSNWTLRQLVQETDQPEQFLKDMLKDLCVYNNKGTNQGTYELKPEYKKSNEETDA